MELTFFPIIDSNMESELQLKENSSQNQLAENKADRVPETYVMFVSCCKFKLILFYQSTTKSHFSQNILF